MTYGGRSNRKRQFSKKDFDKEFEHADPGLMEGIVAGCAIVAYSDGWVAPEEQRRMQALIRGFEPVAAFGLVDVLHFFDEVTARFASDHDQGEAYALSLVQRLVGRPHESQLLIETCCAIAEADGGFDMEERDAILKMCALLGVDSKEHDL